MDNEKVIMGLTVFAVLALCALVPSELLQQGGAIVVGTIAEDVATAGVSVVDDPVTIGAGIAAIGGAIAIL